MSKAESGTTDRAKAPEQAVKKLWDQPSKKWVSYLEQFGITAVQTGADIKLCCPFHADTNPSAMLYPKRGYFTCFSCKEYVHDSIKFLTKISASSVPASLESYQKHFGADKTLDIEKLTASDIQQRRARLLNEVFHIYLCNCWQADVPPESAESTVKWLKLRGVKDVSELGSLGMLPRAPDLERLLKARGADADDVAACKQLLGHYLGVKYTDCVVFTYATSRDRITAFKFRPSGPEGKDLMESKKLDPSYPMGLFGIFTPAFYPLYVNDKIDKFLAVEGEFDQIALYQGQIDAIGTVDWVVVALSGGATSGVTPMRDLGHDKCLLIGDDDAGGASYPTKVFPKSRDIQFQVFQWPATLKHPQGDKLDPDEAIKQHGFAAVYAAVTDDSNYVYALRWCLQRAEAQLLGIHVDDVQGAEKITKDLAELLTDESTRRNFVEEVQKLRPTVKVDAVMDAMRATGTSVHAFKFRMVDWFRKNYQVILWNNTMCELTLWHCKRSHAVKLPINQLKTAITMLVRDFESCDLFEWAETEIGLPPYLPDTRQPDATGTILRKNEIEIEQVLERALHMLIKNANEEQAVVKGQGIHLRDAHKTGVGYIVNGNRAFRLEWNADGTDLVSARQLDGPVDGNAIFDLSPNHQLLNDPVRGWTRLFDEAEDLLETPPFTLEETFRMVRELIDKVFGFEHQDVDSLYCALLVFYNYVYDVIGTKRVLTHVSAQFQSGKTTLLSVTSNHPQLREWSLNDHAHALDRFTQAGFHQLFSNTRLVATLDEMNDENDNSKESEKMRNFYANMRTLALSGHARVTQGTQSGDGRQYHLQNTVITASGTVIHNTMDESRFNTIFMRKSRDRANARMALQQLHTADEYAKLRKSIFLHSLRIAPSVARAYEKMYLTFGSSDEVDAEGRKRLVSTDRFVENLMPLAAIYDVVSGNGKKFIDEYSESRKKQSVEQAVSTAGHELINAVLSTPFPTREGNNSTFTVKSLLLGQNPSSQINSAINGLGVYYDESENHKVLVISWPEARLAFRNHAEIRKNRPKALTFALESASAWSIPRGDAETRGIFRRVRALGMHQPAEVVSVINVKETLIDVVELARKDVDNDASPTPRQQAAGAEDDLPGV